MSAPMTAEPHPSGPTTAVDDLLEAILAGTGIPPELYAADAVLDATLPGWRLTRRGPAAVAAQLSAWFENPSRFEELDRSPIPGGELVVYLQCWEDRGAPIAVHHSHRLELDDAGRIRSDQFFCGGRWNAETLARMAEADLVEGDG